MQRVSVHLAARVRDLPARLLDERATLVQGLLLHALAHEARKIDAAALLRRGSGRHRKPHRRPRRRDHRPPHRKRPESSPEADEARRLTDAQPHVISHTPVVVVATTTLMAPPPLLAAFAALSVRVCEAHSLLTDLRLAPPLWRPTTRTIAMTRPHPITATTMSPPIGATEAAPWGGASRSRARVDLLACRWAQYRYTSTIAAHLAGYALLQAGAVLLADRVAAPAGGAILAIALAAVAFRVHVVSGLASSGALCIVLLAGRAAPWPLAVPIGVMLAGAALLAAARHVYQDWRPRWTDPRRPEGALPAISNLASGAPTLLLFLLLRLGHAPELRAELTERAALRFASLEGRPWQNWARTHA